MLKSSTLHEITVRLWHKPVGPTLLGSRAKSHKSLISFRLERAQQCFCVCNGQSILRRFKQGLFVGLLLIMMCFNRAIAMTEDLPTKSRNANQKAGSLTPEEKRVLRERYARFRQLQPEEQERLRQRLREFENLPPDQKEALKRRQEFLQRLTPEQRQRVRKFYQHWQNLPPERRQRLVQRFRRLKQLPPEKREQVVSQMPFWQRLDPEQRQAFTDLMDHLPEAQPVQ